MLWRSLVNEVWGRIHPVLLHTTQGAGGVVIKGGVVGSDSGIFPTLDTRLGIGERQSPTTRTATHYSGCGGVEGRGANWCDFAYSLTWELGNVNRVVTRPALRLTFGTLHILTQTILVPYCTTTLFSLMLVLPLQRCYYYTTALYTDRVRGNIEETLRLDLSCKHTKR